jgi:hypothetical protein
MAYLPRPADPRSERDDTLRRIRDLEKTSRNALTPDGSTIDPGRIAGGIVQEVVAGTGVTVDNTDPRRPVVSATGGGGGAVDSVNGQTGVVVLDADDVGAQPADATLTALSTTDLADLRLVLGILVLPAGSDETDVPPGFPADGIVIIKGA